MLAVAFWEQRLKSLSLCYFFCILQFTYPQTATARKFSSRLLFNCDFGVAVYSLICSNLMATSVVKYDTGPPRTYARGSQEGDLGQPAQLYKGQVLPDQPSGFL